MQSIMKINFKFINFYLILIFSFFCGACLTNVEEQIETDPTALDPCATITFSMNVKPIIDTNCIQCHGSGDNFPNLTSYNGISANAELVKSETVSRRMPQTSVGLTNDEISAISCWVDAGALND